MKRNGQLDNMVKTDPKACMAYLKGLHGKEKMAKINIALMQVESFLEFAINSEELGNNDILKKFKLIKGFLNE